MSLMVTPEKPLRANAVRAASRIDSRVRSDFRITRRDKPSDAICDRFGGGLRIWVEPARPPTQRAKSRRLRSRQTRRFKVLLVLPDPDVVGQGEFRCGQTRLEIIRAFWIFLAEPVAGEDIGPRVVYRCRADRDDPDSVSDVFAVVTETDT